MEWDGNIRKETRWLETAQRKKSWFWQGTCEFTSLKSSLLTSSCFYALCQYFMEQSLIRSIFSNAETEDRLQRHVFLLLGHSCHQMIFQKQCDSRVNKWPKLFLIQNRRSSFTSFQSDLFCESCETRHIDCAHSKRGVTWLVDRGDKSRLEWGDSPLGLHNKSPHSHRDCSPRYTSQAASLLLTEWS